MSTALPKMPSFRLDGRRALVTGAGRGIGRAASFALAEAGADLFLAARTITEVEEVASEIHEASGRAKAIHLDVTDTSAVKEMMVEMGPFQILVNSAGGNRPQDLLDVSEGDFDSIANLNFRASFFVAQTMAAGLIEGGLPGSIINISSQMGHVGGPKRTVYCATKHAIEGATKAMAWELGKHNIRVNTLCPTFIRTPMVEKFLANSDFHDYVLNNIALKRIGEVEDIMGAVVFLASDASALMTGSALVIDGGWTAV